MDQFWEYECGVSGGGAVALRRQRAKGEEVGRVAWWMEDTEGWGCC